MPKREPPDNDHDILMTLWCAVIGTNGEGIAERVRRLENRGRNNWLVTKDVVLLIGRYLFDDNCVFKNDLAFKGKTEEILGGVCVEY